MPRRTKDAPGRVTPKGGAITDTGRSVVSGRYTAPIPVEYRRSASWVPILMLVFFSAGILMIVLNYLGLLPGATSNWYLLGGLGLMICGFVVATQYR
jgi:hypothetical protein